MLKHILMISFLVAIPVTAFASHDTSSDLYHLTDALRLLANDNVPAPTYGVAIMLRVAKNGWQNIHQELYPLTRSLHTTIAYIETADRPSAERAAKLSGAFLEEKLKKTNYLFCIKECKTLFTSIAGFTPTANTMSPLKQLNSALEDYMAAHGFTFNPLTQKNSYQPHITLQSKELSSDEYVRINKKIDAFASSTNIFCLPFDTVTISLKSLTPRS